MAALKEQSYRLLHDNAAAAASDEDEDLPMLERSSRRRCAPTDRSSTFLKCFSVLSFVLNILLAVLLFSRLWRPAPPQAQAQFADMSPYAGLARHPSHKFPYSSGYGPMEATNHTLADEMWEAIDIDPGIVAVPLDWAEAHNLAETQAFPWDQSKGLYVINAFHSVHCLKIIHRIVDDAQHGRPLSREVEHVLHCIDHMRKDAMCNADDFLLPTPPRRQGNPGPRGQSRICKNWDALVDWARAHDACYQHITDDEVGFARDHHEIERYLHCKPDSPYAQKMREYVDSKGGALQLPSNVQ